jgi:hypothetical protein
VDVTWSNAAAEKAQEWADKCLNKHSGGTLGPLGGMFRPLLTQPSLTSFTENLAAGTGSYSIAEAVKDWTDEVCACISSCISPAESDPYG